MAVAMEGELAAGADEIRVNFSRGQWDPKEWLTFKSLRFDYAHAFVQEDDHIVNPSDPAWSDEELYAKHVTEVYASIVHPKKLVGNRIELSSTMSFDHLMAPIIVLTPELDVDDKGRHAFKKHYEVVLYNEGINVWHYAYDDAKPEGEKLRWHLAAFARAPFSPKTKYELKVVMSKVEGREMRMAVECGNVKVGFEDADLPASFYAGVTGCEGRNRFYDFRATTSDAKLDSAADGEH